MSDENAQLVNQAKKGDKYAFGQLYNHFMPKIYRFTLYLVYDEHLAEDITQEAFLKAWNSLPRFSTKKGTFQAFIYMIARNLAIDHQRRKKAVLLDVEIAEVFSSNENIEEGYSKKEKVKELKNALSTLSVFDKQLILLRYFEELSFSEIAKVVKKKEGAVRVRVHRALATLKESF